MLMLSASRRSLRLRPPCPSSPWGARRAGPCAAAPRRRSLARLLARSSSKPSQWTSAEEAWEALVLSRREMEVAVAEEDYRLAARLRDRIKELTAALPPRKLLMLTMVEQLREPGKSVEERAAALRTLGELGDMDALPQLVQWLGDPPLQSQAEAACWQCFMHTDNPRVQMLLREGLTMMNRAGDWEECVRLFTAVVEEDPHYAEGYNKRATLLFMLQRYNESIADCKVTLELNPYHFGAASGMGMCYSRMGDFSSAIKCFERALAIHPGMTDLRYNIDQLRKLLEQQG